MAEGKDQNSFDYDDHNNKSYGKSYCKYSRSTLANGLPISNSISKLLQEDQL